MKDGHVLDLLSIQADITLRSPIQHVILSFLSDDFFLLGLESSFFIKLFHPTFVENAAGISEAFV